jgi:hypothetical protein
MGLNKHMMIEEADLEAELEELLADLGVGSLEDLEGAKLSRKGEAMRARAKVVQQRLDDLAGVRRRYNDFLGEIGGDKPPASTFNDHREAFERIQGADFPPVKKVP